MGETSIEWTDATWNPVVGCARVSPGCENCYAEVMAARIEKMGQTPRYRGLTVVGKHGPRWAGMARPAPEVLAAPLGWRKPRRVFVNSMSDLFHDDVPFEYIAAVFGVMAAAPHHTFQVLTKRAERMVEFFRWLACTADDGEWTEVHWHALQTEHGDGPIHARSGGATGRPWPLPNVHLGVSVEDQRRADERIPLLLQCPAAVRWVSAEPLLEAVRLRGPRECSCGYHLDWLHPDGITWVVVGGESGRDPRPFDLAWARSIVGQCRAAGTPVFVKQLGANVRSNGVVRPGEGWGVPGGQGYRVDAGDGTFRHQLNNRKGGDPAEWPADLRVRMFPGERWP